MQRVDWTYEMPPVGSSDLGLEEYQVAAPEGDLGRAAALLERDGELFLAVAPSGFPVTHRLVAVPWADVERVDHDSLTVELRSLAGAVELDPDRAVENEPAEARRVEGLPPGLERFQPTGDTAGPVDRWPVYAALGFAAAGFVALLGALALIDRDGPGWRYALVALPVVLLSLALVFGLLAWRRPYAR